MAGGCPVGEGKLVVSAGVQGPLGTTVEQTELDICPFRLRGVSAGYGLVARDLCLSQTRWDVGPVSSQEAERV